MRKLSKVSSDSTSKMYPSIDEEEEEEASSAKEDKLGMMAAARLKFLTFCKASFPIVYGGSTFFCHV